MIDIHDEEEKGFLQSKDIEKHKKNRSDAADTLEKKKVITFDAIDNPCEDGQQMFHNRLALKRQREL